MSKPEDQKGPEPSAPPEDEASGEYAYYEEAEGPDPAGAMGGPTMTNNILATRPLPEPPTSEGQSGSRRGGGLRAWAR